MVCDRLRTRGLPRKHVCTKYYFGDEIKYLPKEKSVKKSKVFILVFDGLNDIKKILGKNRDVKVFSIILYMYFYVYFDNKFNLLIKNYTTSLK